MNALSKTMGTRRGSVVSDLRSLGNVDPGILLSYKVDVSDWQILADDLSPIVTLGIVPTQTVIEEVVKERSAGLLSKAVGLQNSIRLGFL